MAKLTWDNAGERLYETGVEQCVLYLLNDGKYGGATGKFAAWNGVTEIGESPEGAEPTKLYANNGVYLTLMSAETLGLSLSAYMYPNEFAECDGSKQAAPGMYIGQQARTMFGLSYKTLVGNDTNGTEGGHYKLHLVYGCLASPSEKTFASINEDPEVEPMSWEISTTPVAVGTLKIDEEDVAFKPTASIVIDSADYTDTTKKGYLAALEAVLQDDATAELPLPAVVYSYLTTGAAPEAPAV